MKSKLKLVVERLVAAMCAVLMYFAANLAVSEKEKISPGNFWSLDGYDPEWVFSTRFGEPAKLVNDMVNLPTIGSLGLFRLLDMPGKQVSVEPWPIDLGGPKDNSSLVDWAVADRDNDYDKWAIYYVYSGGTDCPLVTDVKISPALAYYSLSGQPVDLATWLDPNFRNKVENLWLNESREMKDFLRYTSMRGAKGYSFNQSAYADHELQALEAALAPVLLETMILGRNYYGVKAAMSSTTEKVGPDPFVLDQGMIKSDAMRKKITSRHWPDVYQALMPPEQFSQFVAGCNLIFLLCWICAIGLMLYSAVEAIGRNLCISIIKFSISWPTIMVREMILAHQKAKHEQWLASRVKTGRDRYLANKKKQQAEKDEEARRRQEELAVRLASSDADSNALPVIRPVEAIPSPPPTPAEPPPLSNRDKAERLRKQIEERCPDFLHYPELWNKLKQLRDLEVLDELTGRHSDDPAKLVGILTELSEHRVPSDWLKSRQLATV